MEEYYFSLVRNTDVILLFLSVLLGFTIIIYALINKWFVGARRQRLYHMMSVLQTLAFKDDASLVNGCTRVMRQASFFEFSDILKRQSKILPGKFSNQLMKCITDSGKIPGIEKIAKNSKRKWRRIEAIIMLGYLNSANALGILEQSLYNRDNDIAYFSLVSLGNIRNEESARILLSNINNKAFSSYKIVSLLENFPLNIVELLIKSLEDKDYNLRLWSIRLIARFKPKQYAKRISDFIYDPSADIRAAACECLGEIGADDFKEAMQKCLGDLTWYVRLQAVMALEKIFKAKSVVDIAPLLKDTQWFIKEKVKEIMIKYFSESLVFIERFLLEENQYVKDSCVEIMDGSGFRKKILDDVISEDIKTREKAQVWLKTMIKAGAHFGLGGILSEYSPDIRQKILNAIATVDRDKADQIGKRFSSTVLGN